MSSRSFTPSAPIAPALLLFRGRGLLSALIRWQTRGKYSHAALLMPDGRIVESWPGRGVRVKMLTDWRGVDAFSISCMTPGAWSGAIAYALAQVGKKYDWWGIIRFISRRHLPQNFDHWFCSELAFESVEEGAGIRLLARIPADEVSPQMLSLSPLLIPKPR